MMTKHKSSKPPKITTLEFSSKMTFLVHESAKDSYELFCDIYSKLNLNVMADFSNKIVNVIKVR